MTASSKPTVVKEHKGGISPQSQMEHIREIGDKIKNKRPLHSAPEYYAVAEYIEGNVGKRVSVMEHMGGTKVSEWSRELLYKGDSKSMKVRSKLLREYTRFKDWLKSKNLPITDLHEGNVLAIYNRDKNRFQFNIIDQ